MALSEEEYLVVSHLQKARIAIRIIADILPGVDGVVSEEDRKTVCGIVSNWERLLARKVDEIQYGEEG